MGALAQLQRFVINIRMMNATTTSRILSPEDKPTKKLLRFCNRANRCVCSVTAQQAKFVQSLSLVMFPDARRRVQPRH